MSEQVEKYWNPYVAGFILGLVLLATFVIMGRGLGASGALMRSVVYVVDKASPAYVDASPYYAKYAGGDKNPLSDWLVFEVIGVIAGGLLSGILAGRMKLQTDKGPNISKGGRLVFALVGGGADGFWRPTRFGLHQRSGINRWCDTGTGQLGFHDDHVCSGLQCCFSCTQTMDMMEVKDVCTILQI
jgi:hypothetical protein